MQGVQPTEGARVSPRTALGARVVRRDGIAGTWSSINVSDGGMFLAGSPLLDPGTDLKLGIVLLDSPDNPEIITQARVIWTNTPPDPGSNPALPAGMGVQFLGLDEESKRLLLASVPASEPSPGGHGEDVEPGTAIGAYTVHDTLGSGGMSTVYLAEHSQLGRRVALKRLHPRWVNDPAAVRRFFDEGRLVNRVRHDHIVEVTDFISEGTDKYYVMELLEGTTLDRLIASGPLPVERALAIAAQLSDALAVVHDAGIIHRDLKPANVMLVDKAGCTDFVKLLDFGVAKQSMPGGSLNLTNPGTVVGTPTYIAPEYSLGAEPDHRSDLYSLGVVIFQLLTGRTPFEASSWSEMLVKHVRDAPPSPSSLAPHGLPQALDALVLALLAKTPEARPAHAREVAARLRAIDLADDLPWVDVMTIAGPPTRPRRTVLALAIAASVLAAAAVGLGFAFSTDRAAPTHSSVEMPSSSPAAPRPQPAVATEPTPPPPPAVATEAPAPTSSKARPRKRRPRKVHRRGTLDPFAD